MAHSTPIEHILRLSTFRLRVNDNHIDINPLDAPGVTEAQAQLNMSTDAVRTTDELKSMVGTPLTLFTCYFHLPICKYVLYWRWNFRKFQMQVFLS